MLVNSQAVNLIELCRTKIIIITKYAWNKKALNRIRNYV
jgi:hypothetical protein